MKRLALTALALAVLASQAGRASTATSAPGDIVFSSTRATDLWGEIYLVRGGTTRNLTRSAADDRAVALSPDGKTVAFVSDRGGTRDALWTMSAAGGHLRRVTSRHAYISAVRWTSSGLEFIVGQQNHQGALHVLDVATGRVRRIARHVAPASFPPAGIFGGSPVSCGPLESRVVLPHGGGTLVLRTHAGMSDANLWTIDATPNARPRPLVTSDTSSWETAARWSPDGRRVVYERLGILSDGGQPCGPLQGPLATVNADGSDAADLTKPDVLGDADPAWSPDGQEIAFARNSISLPDTRNGIFVVDSTGGPARRITAVDRDQSDSTATAPSWSPDGSRVLYQGSDGEMRITRAAGGVGPWTRLHYGLRPSWSPDGDWIAYAHITGGVGPRVYRPRWDLRVATAAGRQERVVAAAGGPEAPVWSPDGRHVAVASPKGVVVATAARGSGRVIVHRAAAHVAWSPDGTKLAFAAWDGGRGLFQQLTPDAPGCCTTDLYVVNADGTGLRRLTHDRALITSVDWRR